VCNKIWIEGKAPEEWTESLLIVIPNIGDLTDCKNDRTITLMLVLLDRLKAQVEDYIANEQAIQEGQEHTETNLNARTR